MEKNYSINTVSIQVLLAVCTEFCVTEVQTWVEKFLLWFDGLKWTPKSRQKKLTGVNTSFPFFLKRPGHSWAHVD